MEQKIQDALNYGKHSKVRIILTQIFNASLGVCLQKIGLYEKVLRMLPSSNPLL